MKKLFLIIFLSTLLSTLNASEEKVGTYEKLGNFVSLDLIFTDENGVTKTLAEFMDNKPTVISLNYYNCPGICGPQIDGILKSLDKMQLVEGKEYKALTISFSPQDTPDIAKKSKKNHLNLLRKDFDQSAWSFLVANDKKIIDTITNELGFKYKKITNKQGFVDYIHPAGLVILSPKGKITRYLSGIKYLHFDLKMALLEASEGKIRPTIAKALAFCFSFDPQNSKYVFATNKIFATIIFTLVFGLFIYLILKGRKKGENL